MIPVINLSINFMNRENSYAVKNYFYILNPLNVKTYSRFDSISLRAKFVVKLGIPDAQG